MTVSVIIRPMDSAIGADTTFDRTYMLFLVTVYQIQIDLHIFIDILAA